MSSDAMCDPARVGVLVVDDDRHLRRMVTMVLEDAEWAVLQAKDGCEALAIVRSSTTPLVVLLDWMLPEMTGCEVLRAVRSDPDLVARHAYVLLTGNAAGLPPHVVDMCRTLAVPVISKPFSLHKLLCIVEAQARRIGVQEAVS